MRTRPVKKVGTEKPTYVVVEMRWSSHELRRTAEIMPTGSAMTSPRMYATPTTARVFGSRCWMSSMTGEWLMNE